MSFLSSELALIHLLGRAEHILIILPCFLISWVQKLSMNHSRLEADLLHSNIFSLSIKVYHNFYPIRNISFPFIFYYKHILCSISLPWLPSTEQVHKQGHQFASCFDFYLHSSSTFRLPSNLTTLWECCVANHPSPFCNPQHIHMYFLKQIRKA